MVVNGVHFKEYIYVKQRIIINFLKINNVMKIIRDEVQNEVSYRGGITDLIDGVIYLSYNITSDELDKICTLCIDEELNDFIDGLGSLNLKPTFSQMKKGLEIRNKYVDYYKK